MEVWVQLGEYQNGIFGVDPTPGRKFCRIFDLKKAVKAVYKNDALSDVEAPSLCVSVSIEAFSREEYLKDDLPIPDNTTSDSPLRVFLQPGLDRPNKKLKIGFPISLLHENPLDVVPYAITVPKFVSTHELDNIETIIQHDFERECEEDMQDGFERIPPTALVRCSRGGKTRALTEIAKKIRERMQCAVIFVTFNDWSQYDPKRESGGSLAALFRRIAFVAAKDFEPKPSKWQQFRNQEFAFDECTFLQWLGETPAVLLVDELNQLTGLAADGNSTNDVQEFGMFVKTNFLDMANRYFIFSSHVLGSCEFFSQYVDFHGSTRTVTLQELPMVHDMCTATNLNNSFCTPRKVVYYGQMPSMLHELNRGKSVAGKSVNAVKKYIASVASDESCVKDFKNLLSSLITGDYNQIPAPLHVLLDSHVADETKRIRWVPCHLEYVMQMLHKCFIIPQSHLYFAKELEKLCSLTVDAKEEAGDAWEGLFVLLLLARAITALDQKDEVNEDGSVVAKSSLLPAEWFFDSPTVTYNKSYRRSSNSPKYFFQCKSWDDLKLGLVLGDGPQVSLFYPTHASFETYDAIAVLSVNKQISHVYGYQCKEGKANAKQPVHPDMSCSFVLKGQPPEKSMVHQQWMIPGRKHIDNFFGSSGKYWTPKEWKRLLSPSPMDCGAMVQQQRHRT